MEKISDLLQKMHVAMTRTTACLPGIITAFSQNAPIQRKHCSDNVEAMRKEEVELTLQVAELAKENHDLKSYISIPRHILRIGENIEKLSDLTSRKSTENLLFSDRAVTEIATLLQKMKDTLKSTSDLLLVTNPVLARYVLEAEIDIVGKAIEYATLHEERLIEGTCLPLASSVFLSMLDAIRDISWDAKEIAGKFATK